MSGHTTTSVAQHVSEIETMVAQANHEIERVTETSRISCAFLSEARNEAQAFLDRHRAKQVMKGQYEDIEVSRTIKEALANFKHLSSRS